MDGYTYRRVARNRGKRMRGTRASTAQSSMARFLMYASENARNDVYYHPPRDRQRGRGKITSTKAISHPIYLAGPTLSGGLETGHINCNDLRISVGEVKYTVHASYTPVGNTRGGMRHSGESFTSIGVSCNVKTIQYWLPPIKYSDFLISYMTAKIKCSYCIFIQFFVLYLWTTVVQFFYCMITYWIVASNNIGTGCPYCAPLWYHTIQIRDFIERCPRLRIIIYSFVSSSKVSYAINTSILIAKLTTALEMEEMHRVPSKHFQFLIAPYYVISHRRCKRYTETVTGNHCIHYDQAGNISISSYSTSTNHPVVSAIFGTVWKTCYMENWRPLSPNLNFGKSDRRPAVSSRIAYRIVPVGEEFTTCQRCNSSRQNWRGGATVRETDRDVNLDRHRVFPRATIFFE